MKASKLPFLHEYCTKNKIIKNSINISILLIKDKRNEFDIWYFGRYEMWNTLDMQFRFALGHFFSDLLYFSKGSSSLETSKSNHFFFGNISILVPERIF